MEKQRSSLSILRERLKYEVYNDRKELGKTPLCPICDGGFTSNAPSMHEVFIFRGHVRGCKEEVQHQIYVPENVVLIHEGNCHLKAQHEWASKIACAIQIIRYESYESVLNWMNLMDSLLRLTDNQKFMLLEEAREKYDESAR